jgi:hypothetical protein
VHVVQEFPSCKNFPTRLADRALFFSISALLVAHRDELGQEMTRLRARRRFLENRIAYWEAQQRDDVAETQRLAAEGDRLAERLG